jgi:tetratricopeptide (TPR) repeat protein
MLDSLLIPLAVLAVQQQAPVTIVQQTSGWCSPVIANVVGNVTVNCIGVDPRALKWLNAELTRKNLQFADRIREADEWTSRYKELEARLTGAADDSALSHKAEEYLHEGELENAGAILDQILKSEEKQIDQTAGNHYNRALVFELQFRPLDALPHLEKAYRYRPKESKYGKAYAYLLLNQNDFRNAEAVLVANIKNARQLAKAKPTTYLPYVADNLTFLAMLYQRTQRLEEASDANVEALKIRIQLVNANGAVYLPDVAISLNNMGTDCISMQQLQLAEEAHLLALDIYRRLAKAIPNAYQRDVAETLNKLGNVYSYTHQTKEAESAYREALDIRRQLAKADLRYQPYVSATLNHLADLYSNTQRTKEAEAAYREALEISRRLAKENPAAYQSGVSDTLNHLADLYSGTQRTKEAEAAYREALEIRRQLAKVNPAAYEPDVAETLNNLGILYHDTNLMKDAESTDEEALAIEFRLSERNSLVYLPTVGTTLNNMATLYLDTQRLQEAETASQKALLIFRWLAKVNPVVYEVDLARTLNILARVDLQIGNLRQADAESQEAVSINRERWKSDPSAANALARSLVISSEVQKGSPAACKLAREAADIAQSPTLRKLATVDMVTCLTRQGHNMTDWIKVLTHPLGLAGFALFLVFGFLAKVKKNVERRWVSQAAVTLACAALAGGLILAYIQVPKSPTPSTQTNIAPANQQTNQVQQSTAGPGSPAVQGVQGDVTITVDQSNGETMQKKPAEKKPDQKQK